MSGMVDVIVVGSGMSGLACARDLVEAGRQVVVLERSARVGGRCASKSPGPGFPEMDFGPVFVHGRDPAFLDWLRLHGRVLLPGWPGRVRGSGPPCQPSAFEGEELRFGLRGGIRLLAESLAAGLDLRMKTEVLAFDWKTEGFLVRSREGGELRGRHLVLALALEQTRALLRESPRIEGLLLAYSSLPSLTLLAGYRPGLGDLPWDVWYPEESRSILLISDEGGKQGLDSGEMGMLAIQARPAWSAARIDGDRGSWTRDLLAEAARLVGPRAGEPAALLGHRWRHGRLAPSDHLVRPALFDLKGSEGRLGLAGDLFNAEGGLEGAWLSGRALAARILAETG